MIEIPEDFQMVKNLPGIFLMDNEFMAKCFEKRYI